MYLFLEKQFEGTYYIMFGHDEYALILYVI